jgi:hypothetical protein
MLEYESNFTQKEALVPTLANKPHPNHLFGGE